MKRRSFLGALLATAVSAALPLPLQAKPEVAKTVADVVAASLQPEAVSNVYGYETESCLRVLFKNGEILLLPALAVAHLEPEQIEVSWPTRLSYDPRPVSRSTTLTLASATKDWKVTQRLHSWVMPGDPLSPLLREVCRGEFVYHGAVVAEFHNLLPRSVQTTPGMDGETMQIDIEFYYDYFEVAPKMLESMVKETTRRLL